MMKTLSQLLFALCAVLFPLFVYAQEDTLNADGLFPKYNLPSYKENGLTNLTMEQIRNGDISSEKPDDSDIIRGELLRSTQSIGLIYEIPSYYVASEMFYLQFPPVNPNELLLTTDSEITSQWIHEDGECILFIKCSGSAKVPKTQKVLGTDGRYTVKFQWVNKDSVIDKLVDLFPDELYLGLKRRLTVSPTSLKEITPEEKESLKQQVTFWSRSEAEDVFNAQYVITYPIKSKHSVYMGKYTHVYDLIMLKWGEHLTVSFLVTKKGKRHLDQYIEDVKGAFRFED